MSEPTQAEKESVIELMKKLKYKKPLTSIEKVILIKAGLIKVTSKGLVLTPKGKHHLEVVEREYGEL